MRKIISVLLAAFIGFAVTAADKTDDSALRQKLAKQLLNSMGVKKQILISFAEIRKIHGEIIDKTLQNAENSKEVAEFKKKMYTLSDNGLSWKKVKGVFIKIYAEAYSADELEKLNAFFSSPTGKAFLKKTPELQRQIVKVIQKQIKDTSLQVRNMTREFMKAQMLKGQTKIPTNLKSSTLPAGK